ncbi:MAG: aspartate--ammonia ligase [Anaeroplasmataceae bacterium]|nr:aspartate--ammonia ligase [Anaeroplasmataceae bacterium]
MKRLFLLKDYTSKLDLLETEKAIKFVKDNFERDLASALSLIRVSAPLFVLPSSGLNDELNGTERRIDFQLKDIDESAEIVQSLAKWKRNALAKYHFPLGKGLYTDMNAIRRDEELDSIHSAYVDQWDWEKSILAENRNLEYLKFTVQQIYKVIKQTEQRVCIEYPVLKSVLPEEIFFITTKELEALYPELSPVEREYKICLEKRAVFLMQIGEPLSNGLPHDGRAADYDDWTLNGDILVYYEELDIAFELSSMGIRVDKEALIRQLFIKKEEYKLNNPYVIDILHERLPYTIGGGIGQSRLCMFFLKKAHIGEVQASLWSAEDILLLKKHHIELL